MTKHILLIVALLLLGTSFAEAQSIVLGPQLGFYSVEDAEDDFNVMVGVTARMKLLPALGVEGSINYRQESYFGDDLTVKSWPVMVTGLLYPAEVVYGAVGFGWYNTTYDFADGLGIANETEQEVGWHFGGGVELPLGKQAVLTGDVRYVFLDYDFGEPPGFGDIDADFYVITAGLLFRL